MKQGDVQQALAQLREQFIEQLPAKLAEIERGAAHLNPTERDDEQLHRLHRLAHSLHGSAGTFGLHALSKAAGQLERLVEQWRQAEPAQDCQAITQALSAALEMVQQLGRSAAHGQGPTHSVPQVEQRTTPQAEPSVYIVEDAPQQGEQLYRFLRQAGYRPRLFTELEAFAEALQEDVPPAAVIMDMVFPDGELAGAEYVQRLKQQHDGQFPPVLFLSVRRDLDARLAAYRSGSAFYLNKPVDSGRLLRQLDQLTQRVPAEPYRVLMVDDDELTLEAQATVLRAAGMAVTTLSEPLQTLEQIDQVDPEVLILDYHMPQINGPELAALLREDERYQQLPIVFLSAELDEEWQRSALHLGGDDFLPKPLEPGFLSCRVLARARRYREYRADQTRMQQLLYEREREHLALNQHAIVSIADRAGNITYVNDLFCEVSGYTREELLGQNHRLLKSGQHPDSLYQAMWATITAGQVWSGEVCNRRKDGSFYWVESTITPFMDDSGQPYQYVSIRTDISQVKAIQNELQQAVEEVDSAKERLHRGQLFANIGTWEWNIVSGELFWTERIAPLFGYPAGDLETSYDNFMAAIHPDDRQAVSEAVSACVERDAPYEIEHRVVWPDGTVRWLSERGAVERDEAGKPLRMLGVVQDIHDRKRAEMELVLAKEGADRANQAKSDFLSSMSHELRTPMNAILGFAQLLEYDDTLDQDQQDSVHEIIKAGNHLLALINEVLDLAKVESGQLSLSLEPVALGPVVEECLSLIHPLAQKRSIRIRHAGLEHVQVRADRTRLKQVLLNLLSNAVKYNRDGGEVELKIQTEGSDRLRVLVSDTGNGIPAERLSELFEPFNRLDAEGTEVEGTGIGLTITRRIMELMGGSIEAESEVGVGSTFWLELPLEDETHSDEPAEQQDGLQQASEAAERQHLVLYIEDNPANLKLVANILGKLPHIHLLSAHLPELGLELAQSRQPDLILLDINMPGMDGYQVLRILRQNPALAEVPVIAVSANAMPEDIKRGMEAGFTDYMTKPIQVREFVDGIEHALAQAGAAQNEENSHD